MIPILDQQSQRGARCAPGHNTGQNARTITFNLHPWTASIPALPPPELVVDNLFG
jgi:hypothetical protein